MSRTSLLSSRSDPNENSRATPSKPVTGCKILRYSGSAFLRQRLVLSTISSVPVAIRDIRLNDTDPGLRDYEVSFVKLLQRVTDGSKIKIDETGTRLTYHPGIISGGARPSGAPGADVTPIFDTDIGRCLTYYLEPLILLAPFCKRAFSIRLRGVTNGSQPDASVDTFRTVTLPFLKYVGVGQGLNFEVVRRGLPPVGGGEILFECPQLRKVKPFEVLRGGRVKRVRGVAFTHGVSQQFAVKCIDKARGILNDFIPDVWIYTDSSTTKKKKLVETAKNIKGAEGYGISLVAETIKGCYKGADMCVDRPLQDLVAHIDSSVSAGLHDRSKVPFHLLADAQIDGYRYSNADTVTWGPPPPITVHTKSFEAQVQEEDASNVETFCKLTLPEKIGYLTATRLISEIYLDGVVDSHHQYLPLYFMALAEQYKISKVALGALTPYTVQWLRHIKDFLNVEFSFAQNPTQDPKEKGDSPSEEESLAEAPVTIVSCLGMGYINIARKSF